jgi:Bacterial dipeptidyl-peptidase Sh3 domain/NlpC/P60 family
VNGFEPRLHAFRPEVADAKLKGKVEAKRFVEAISRRVVAASAPLKHTPRPEASLDSEALRGEVFRVFEETMEGWSWGQLETDGHVGYVPTEALGSLVPEPSHRVTALRTFVYPGPDLKLPVLSTLSIGSRLALAGEIESRGTRYQILSGGPGAVVASHVAILDEPGETDFVAVAERFLGTPYLWGGRTSLGLDCSALVQLSLAACGHAAPRDTDLQESMVGEAVEGGITGKLARGDLVFWRGHVGILADRQRIVHASGADMKVVSEPLGEALRRIARVVGAPTSVRRLASC